MEKENEEKKPVFKKFCVDGKVLGRWVKEESVTEYDERGNEIHYKNSDGNESWYEYEYWENGKIKKEICYVPM